MGSYPELQQAGRAKSVLGRVTLDTPAEDLDLNTAAMGQQQPLVLMHTK